MDFLGQFSLASFTHHFALSPDTLAWSRVTFFLRQCMFLKYDYLRGNATFEINQDNVEYYTMTIIFKGKKLNEELHN